MNHKMTLTHSDYLLLLVPSHIDYCYLVLLVPTPLILWLTFLVANHYQEHQYCYSQHQHNQSILAAVAPGLADGYPRHPLSSITSTPSRFAIFIITNTASQCNPQAHQPTLDPSNKSRAPFHQRPVASRGT
ncbi:hypothetical protein M431DRAFT_175075 [Trichoderma harzianum CBS 226.95]|uniref:Uncharacterized protein n=1 Tax=Trichoderma harzianum CBS 226.95 TaxID=983964 RepID=A0A2T4AT48_TRIHA|nr:hypothetical protein M431DRAFT_175075 [Trichoderma harzianum CBS 226.95]PTB60236.1 hypothetical protein M431DRAFT_175075 [Trichoderma harzianum CBS 226.95]